MVLPLDSEYRKRKYNNAIQPSELFASRDLVKQLVLSDASISDEELEKLQEYRDLFSPEGIAYRDALAGKVTLGIIKPDALGGINEELRASLKLPKDEDKIVRHILENEIGKNLTQTGLALDFGVALQITWKRAEELYGLNKEQFQRLGFWKQLIDYTTSGPMTILLLRDPSGEDNAIVKWRRAIGTTHVNPKENSLRGRYAKPNNLPNNMFHGSGSPEEAAREIAVVGDLLKELYNALEKKQDRDILEAAEDKVPPQEEVLFVKKNFQVRKGNLPPRLDGITVFSVYEPMKRLRKHAYPAKKGKIA